MRREGIVVSISMAMSLAGNAACAQSDTMPSAFTDRGHVSISGREVPYVIHRLPVLSFPALPEPIASHLEQLGCLIPQTFQAHQPENVIHASLEKAGSSDWAVLCSSGGTVKLMVFFGSEPDAPVVLASEAETARLETHDLTGVLGFAWGIDPASPRQVREAQAGMEHHHPPLDHDALADTFVEKSTTYHFFAKKKNTWEIIDTTD